MERYDIYLRGFSSSEPAVAGLQRVFGIDPKRAAELVRSLPRVIKREVPSEQAERYQQALSSLGADFELRRSPIRPQRMIAVLGSTRNEELELPGPASSPPARAAVLAVADSWVEPAISSARTAVEGASIAPAAVELEARDVRTLGATWSESPPAPSRSLGDTLSEAPAAPPPPSAPPRGPSITLPESTPPPPVSRPPAAEALSWAHPPELMQPRLPKLVLPAAEPASAPVASLSNAWAPTPADELGSAADSAGPPAAWQAGALDISLEQRGQPGWLLENRTAYPQNEYEADVAAAVSDPFDPPPSVRPSARAAAGARTRPLQSEARSLPPARPERGSNAHAHVNANAVQAAPQPAPPAIGLVAGRELATDEPSELLRWVMRVGIGLSLFVILTTVRHCRSFETGVEQTLARWNQPGEHGGVPANGAAADGAYGPDALAWLEPDLHLVSSGDKDRVRTLARNFLAAGAAGVFVGTISPMGMTQVAGELIVQLPADPAARKAVLDVHDQFLASSFGGVAVAGAKPEGDLLHITL
ncbi:MAG TPA: hypothetical protein VK524_04270 [Polyangiaceae bacterium]|nr:hypothetical protein [Polyangiaceae bacterium]